MNRLCALGRNEVKRGVDKKKDRRWSFVVGQSGAPLWKNGVGSIEIK